MQLAMHIDLRIYVNFFLSHFIFCVSFSIPLSSMLFPFGNRWEGGEDSQT